MKNKVFRFLSIVLTICMIFSVCNIVLYANAESVTRVYYVKTDGLSENDGLTSDTPLPTVAEVIAKCGDMVAGDNIIVNVMGDSVQTGTLGTYAATLTVQSADSQVKTKVYGVASPYINGPTVFKNVILATAEGQATRFYFSGHNVTLESDVEISGIDHVASNSYSSNSTIPGQTMVFNNAITSTQKLFLPNIGSYNNTKYTEDFNLIVNNASANISIGTPSYGGAVTYQKNFNYFVKNAASFTQAADSGTTVKGAFQVIISSATTVNAASKTNLSTIGSTATGGYYYVTVDSSVIGALSLTETAGKYAIEGDITLKAVNTETMEEVESKDGFLELTAGEWGVSQVFPPVTRTYFVSDNGSAENDGLSDQTPLPTVADVIAKCSDMRAEDNIIVRVMGESATMGTLETSYVATLTIQSNDPEVKTVLKITNNANVALGPTVFKNVAVNNQANTTAYLLGSSIVIDSDATTNITEMVFNANNSVSGYTKAPYYSANKIPGQTVELKNAYVGNIFAGNNSHFNGLQFTQDATIIVDNANAKPTFGHTTYYGGGTTYAKNLNYFVKNATSATFGALGASNSISLKGAMQVVVNSSTTITDASKANMDAIATNAAGGYYYVTVESAVIGNLSLTETAGKYAVSGDVSLKAVNKAGTKEIKSADGYLILPEAGEWEVTQIFPPVERNYYIDAVNGLAENDGRTPDTAVPTVADAVAKATDLDEDDTIIANLIGSTATMDKPVKYTAKLLVKSYDANSKTTLTITGMNSINGPTVFKNLTLSNGGTTLYLSGKDVTIESDVDFGFDIIAANTYNGTEKDNQGSYFTGPAKSQTIVLKKAYSGTVIVSNAGHTNNIKFNDDANLIIDNANAAPKIAHNTYYPNEGSTRANFYGDFNYYFKNAKSVTIDQMRANVVYNIEGAFQVVKNKNTTINDSSRANLDAIGALAQGGYFYVTVDNTDGFEMTPAAGVYKIAENYYATAVNTKTLQEVESDADGELVLTAGEWDVTVKKQPVVRDYYVKADGTGNGLSYDSPMGTVADVINAATDLVAGDTIRVNLIGSSVTMGTLPEYAATLYLQSADADTKTAISADATVITNGPTVFKNVKIAYTNTDGRICFRGDDVTLESDVDTGGLYTLTYNDYSSSSKLAGQTVVIKTPTGYTVRTANDGHFNSTTYSEDVNLILDNASAVHSWSSDTSYGGTAYYKKNLNIIVRNARRFDVTALGKDDMGTNNYNITGGLQVLVNMATEVSDASKTNVATIGENCAGGRYYYIKLTDDVFDAVEVTAVAGKYKVAEGYQAVATKTDGTVAESEDGILELTPGEWSIALREEKTTLREEYINYRADLSNTYSKLVNDKELNVVYFGGSVTSGYGVENTGTQSWRGKIGTWLQSTFPNATVNNYNCACGESGTFLGSYRLARDVLSKEPDLMFLEYSINDKYDYASYERASMQYETIVRTVKKTYPDCDIVTVLVTDSGVAEAARKENGSQLHTQAQAHEDVAKHYNIPTLHVGRYLADSLPDNWSYDTDWKGNVAIDTVHLTEKGNDIYLEVIKEFMNNCLVYGGYDADYPTEYPGLPEMVNDKLLDGNITYIQPSAELIARSEELGGSGFTYSATGYSQILRDYDPLLSAGTSENGAMLAVEFNGTELIALMHNYSSSKKFQLKVDDGEWQEVSYYHMNPQTIVTGLEPGDHTVYFKPTFKDGESWQWIGALYSRDDSKATTRETAGPVNKSYYVKNGGTGDGRTPETPAASVADVIASINADGLKAEDTANVYIMQRDDWNTIPAGKIGTSSTVGENVGDGIANGNNIVQPHFMTAWSAGTTAPTHKAKVVVKSYDSSNKSYLAMSQYLGLNASVSISGPTVFDDVTLVYTRNSCDTRVASNYYDLTFTNKFSGGYVNCSEYNSAHSWDGKVYSCDVCAEFAAKASTADSKITINSAFNRLIIAHDYYGNYTMAHDFDIEVDNGGKNINFYWGPSHTNGCTTTINGDVRFNIKSAGTINNYNNLNSTNKSSVVINGTFQYIYNSTATLNNKPSDLLIQVDETTKRGVVINGDAWYIKNTSGYGDLLSYTAKPGTYKVDERYEVTATNDDTNATVKSQDGQLVLSAGNWTVSGSKIPVYKNYYVKNGGTGSGRTPETPAGTVKQVIDSVNEDLVAGDIANIYIMQREDYNSVTGMATGTVHNFTSWTTMDLGGSMTEHSAKIVIKPYDPEVKTYITYNDKYWTQSNINFGGDTEFEDVVIVDTRGNYDVTALGNKNVKFGEGVSYGVLRANSTVEIYATRVLGFASNGSGNQKIELYNATTSQLWVAAPSYGVYTRTGNVNVVIDNKLDTNKPAIYWGMTHSSGTKTQNGNINILVKNAYSITHTLGTSSYGIGKHTINGAVQLITRSDVVVSGSPADFSDKVTIRDGIWDLRYVSDADDALDFTETTGEFKVKEGYTATAVTADGTKIASENGILTLAAGKYMVYVNDEFSNTGDEILVHKQVELDVETIAHEEKEDKLFVGWKDKATGEYVDKVGTYGAGDVLVAVYVDYQKDTDFYYDEAMTTEDGGLRFIFSRNKALFNAIPEVLETGAVVLPTDDGGYYDIFLDEPVVKTWKWDEETKYDFQPDATGKTPSKVQHLNVLEENEDTVKYTLCVTDLAESKYAKYYNAKGFIKYEDYNGIVNVLYTEQGQASLYQTSSHNDDKRDIDNTIISVVEKQLADKKADYYATRTLAYGSGTEGDVYNIYKYGGMNIRDLVIDTGIEGMTETDIFFISDPHFNYISRKDTTNGLATTLSSYRGRSWARDGWSISPAIGAVNFGASFDHIVMGGDAVDYISYGALDVTSRVFTQRAVNDNITMVTGNHEVEELSQPDMSLSNILSVEQRHKFCQPGWSNDVYYSSRIINGKVMVIGLDNSRVIYWDSQLEPLTRDLQYARENGMAVLIFQHIPLLTMNPEENEYKFGTDYRTDIFGEYYTKNMSTYTGYVGLKTDESTQEVYTLIRQNADIIKGIFHGHEHSNMYTEIVGLDAEGNPTDARIPQHGIAGIHYSAAMAIKIK